MEAYVATGEEQQRVIVKEVPEPVAEAGTVLVEVRAISLNRGEISGLAAKDSRPGWDIAGVVIQDSGDGRGPAVGSRVAAVVREGGWAQRVAVPVGQVGVIPDSVSMEEASTLGIAGITALRALRTPGLLAGKRVLVTGASGAVGRFAVQLAALYAATVTATVNRADQVADVQALGAHQVVVDGSELDGQYDVVIDGVGGTALEAAVRAAAPGAKILTYGIAGGAPAALRFADFRNGPGSTLQGFFIWQSDLGTFGKDLTYLAKLVGAGALSAHVAGTYAWPELGDALDALIHRRASGKLVVQVG